MDGIRVLHVVDQMGLGGAQTIVRSIVENSGKDTFLYILRKTDSDQKIDSDNVYGNDSNERYSLRGLLRIRKLIKDKKITVLHCHLFRSQFYGFLLKFFFARDCKLIFHEHGRIRNLDRFYLLFLRLSYPLVNKYIAVSKKTEGLLLKGLGSKTGGEKVITLYNFLAKVYTDAAQKFTRRRKKNSLFTIGFAGRLIESKGWKDFLEVARHFKNDKRLKFVVAGDGPDRSKFEEFINEHDLKNVEYRGLVFDMPGFYRDIDCLIMTTYTETFGLVSLEAQSFGVPVILTEIPGLSEVVNPGQDCLGFAPGDIKTIIKHVNYVYANEDFRNKLIENGVKNSLKYSVDKYLPRLKQLYRELNGSTEEVNKIRIGFVARGLTLGGVSRFIINTLKELDKDNRVVVYLLTDEKSFVKKYRNIEVVYIPPKNKLYWDYFLATKELLKRKLDVVIYPKNIIPLSHIIVPTRKVNIITDLAYFASGLDAYKFFDTLYMKLFMRVSCLLSYKTLAISENTKNDVVKILGIKPDHIVVNYFAAEDNFKRIENKNVLAKIKKKFGLKTPFIFYLGSISPRKNIMRTVLAFEKIMDKIPHNLYVFSGKRWGSNQAIEYIKRMHNKRAQILPEVTDEELVGLYSMADLYLYPSLYEGFGLPILEAQSCGCPVLTSNVTSCPEVAGDGAIMVDPYSVDEIADGMQRILKNKKLKEKLVENGYKNAKRFTWSETSRNIINLATEKDEK